ncbi:MAG: hypothetical protein AAF724_06430 [Pseudomonadota bacterium]
MNYFRETDTKTARDLSFLSFLHWVVLKRDDFDSVNSESGQKNRLEHDYNLFLSTFDGPWQPYVDAFSDVLGHAIDFVWSFSIGYPGSKPDSKFRKYIFLNQLDAHHHYTAYPIASVRDVRRALHLQSNLSEFAEQSKDLEPEQFAQEFRRLLIRVQNDLGTIGPLEK